MQRFLKVYAQITALITCIFALMSCGGGGGGNDPTPPPTTPTPAPITYTIDVATSPVAAVASAGTTADATITWSFSSSATNPTSTSYTVTSSTSGVEITGGSGSVTPGTSITTQLSFTCSAAGNTNAQIALSVGSASETLTWSITCTVEDISEIHAKFHQGPLLEQITFTLEEEQWVTSDHALSYADQRVLTLATNRQLFLTIEFGMQEEIDFDVDLAQANPSDEATIEKISASTLPPNASGSRTNYVRRVVFDIHAADVANLGSMRLTIDPQDDIPQRNEELNEITFEMSRLEYQTLPHLQLTLIPIRSVLGEPSLSDPSIYTDSLFELMPVGPMNVMVGEPLDVTNQDPFDAEETLGVMWDRWINNADRNEYYHGIFAQTETPQLCGLAYISHKVGITGEINDFCSDNTMAHEIGHNLSLLHAPACGAENADPDPDFPYADGGIGVEGGWLMKSRRPAGAEGLQTTKLYDTMAYCLESFTTQYSYGKAQDFFVASVDPIVVASRPPRRVVAGFEMVEGRSMAISGIVSATGEWTLRNLVSTDKSAFTPQIGSFDYEIRVIHMPSGTVLHSEGIDLVEIAHGKSGNKTWGSRIPLFEASDLYINIMDKENNSVFENGFNKAD